MSSNGYTMDEMKSALIKVIKRDNEWLLRQASKIFYPINSRDLSNPHKVKDIIRKTQNPDLLEHIANVLIDAGIYFEDGRFYFPDEEELDYE